MLLISEPVPSKVDWPQLISEINSPNNDALYLYLKKLVHSGQSITNLADDKGFNLLHHGVLKGFPGKLSFLVDTCQEL